jgi:hypothetical protein
MGECLSNIHMPWSFFLLKILQKNKKKRSTSNSAPKFTPCQIAGEGRWQCAQGNDDALLGVSRAHNAEKCVLSDESAVGNTL